MIYFDQGAKKSGWEIFLYDPRYYLIFKVDLPVTFQVEDFIALEGLRGMLVGPLVGLAFTALIDHGF